MGYKRLRSPKHLVEVDAWVPTPEDVKDTLAEADGLKHRKITVEEAIRLEMAYLKKTSIAALRREGKDPSRYRDIIRTSEFADRAYCAALVLRTIDEVEPELVYIEESCGGIRDSALDALYLALECAYHLQLLTLADHEPEIVTGKRTAGHLRELRSSWVAKRRNDSKGEWDQWNAEAARIWARNPKLSRQAVARRLKLKLGLEVRERTIAKKLNKPGTVC
jgi:hypothetical protein